MKTSVLTVTHNRPDYLARAIHSVLAQTDSDWEHLIWDNGGPPSSHIGCARVSRRDITDPRRVWYVAGADAPRVDRPAYYWNRLLEEAQGKYVTILDDDNEKHLRFLERMTESLDKNPDVDAVTCGWQYIGVDGAERGVSHLNMTTSLAALYRDNTVDGNALLFRRSVIAKIGPFAEDLTTCEDWHFVIRLVQHCNVLHLDDVLLNYRCHEGQRTHRMYELGAEANWERVRAELFPSGPPR